jgi:S-DNA-T family DNA segregation ATPase FtsK/SpoIIIE
MQNRHGSQEKHLFSEAASIFVFALCIFSLFSLLTYNSTDPSFFSNSHGIPLNSCGRIGAYLSSALLQWFGLGSFLVPAALVFIATTIHKREGSIKVVGTLGGMTVAVMALTVFVTLQWTYWPYSGTLMLTGGAFGAWVAQLLLKELNPLGSSITTLLVFCLALAMSTPVSVAKWGARTLAWLSSMIWRLLKLSATFLAYSGGVIAMKTVKFTGDSLQQLYEAALRAAKERAAAAKIAAQQRKEDEARELKAIAETEKENKKAAQRSATDAEIVQLPAVEGELVDADTEVDAIDVAALKAATTTTSQAGEAPNVLPELEAAAAQAALLAKPQGNLFDNGPVILPREHTGATEDSEGKPTLGTKMVNKISKLAKKRGQWKIPTAEFLRKPPKIESQVDKEKLVANSKILEQKFADFGIDGQVTAVRPGPVITLYEFKPGPGIKVSRIASLADDLSMALSAQSVRILAPLPGKSVVGIEIPSDVRETVFMREFISNPDFNSDKHNIPIAMGKDIAGQTYISDLARMPHLLCAGQTGSGKSVFMNGLICSLLYRFTPDELRMILVDPKYIEFRAYQDIPHLLLPVVDDAKHASTALKWAVREMERRYRILAKIGAKNLASFNQKVGEMGADVVRDLLFAEENQEGATPSSGSDWIEAFEPDEGGSPRVGKLPYIVIIIDELADLMMIAKKEVEISIARIAQKARAAGIHLVIATQRPSTDIITGLIKANLPSRVSFQLASFIDSRTILDRPGAERLLGHGDMLFIPPGVSQTVRLHGAYVDDEEISKITAFLKDQGEPAYRDEILLADDEEDGEDGDMEEDADELFEDAVNLVRNSGHASASFLQRHLKVGYNRAARMIETMESRGIVGPADGARPREVLLR